MNKERRSEVDPLLKWHLDTDHIDIPDIPLKRSRFQRFMRYLASPAVNPFEIYVTHTGSLSLIAFTPILIAAIFTVIQLFIV
ncbi:hypothetical protein [Cytobacillus purgationiresistens]|uniref:Uncharacterized protein n=1 Tax=Cytobacillus purgationiresistens TaxID=863449 RepID=A0ABU0APL1_9BACI|nr:hypothetical protein [Cytobacillus purgationiresistens]MDQ0273224.1 hypothetical protein [Cytobacillus purgationiresistens]